MVKSLMCGTEIINDMYIADSFVKRFMGYMFQKKPSHRAILIKPCSSIHTFFMKFNIDVLFINENMEVVMKIGGLKPGKVIMPVKEAVIVIEAREGKFENIKTGSRVNIFCGDNVYGFNEERLITFI